MSISENPYSSPIEQGQKPPETQSKFFGRFIEVGVCFLAIGVLIAMLLPARRGGGAAARRAICSNNLKQLALAVHNYASVHGHLPPAYTVDDQGQRLHSWRTLILPYIDQKNLYDSIDLKKPWDDPVNQKARNSNPDVFRCPQLDLKPGFTTYLANAGEKGALLPGKKRLLKDFVDGKENTVLFFEVNADQAVEWMSPQDEGFEAFLKTIGDERQPHPGTMNVVMADASVRTIYGKHSEESSLLPFFTIADKDKAVWPE